MKTRYSSGGVSIKRLIVGAVAAVFAIAPNFATASTIDITYFTDSGCSGSASGGSSATLGSTTCANGSGSTTVSGQADLDTVRLNLASTFTDTDGAHAMIRIQDLITVTGGTGTGSITFDWVFDGTLAASESYISDLGFSNLGGAAFADFRACGDSANVPIVCVADLFGPYAPATENTTVSDQTRSITIPFTFDVPFAVDWRLSAVIYNRCVEFNSCTPGRPGGGDVQFGDKLQLQPLIVRDAAGSQLDSVIVTSDSDARYEVASTPGTVPEPSMLVLLSGGLLTALGIRRRRK
jgi:hypothetical protein